MKKKSKKTGKEKPKKKILNERKVEEQQYVDSLTEVADDTQPDYPFDEKNWIKPDQENKQDASQK